MSLLEDLAARLAAARAALPTEHMQHARQVLDESADRVATLGRTSQDHSLTHAHTGLTEASQQAQAAADCLTNGAEHLATYLSDPIGIPAPDTSSTPPSTTPTIAPRAQPAPYYLRHAEALPERPTRRSPTTGTLTTSSGETIEQVQSGTQGPGAGGPDLRQRWQRYVTATQHAEGHAAAVLRALYRDTGTTEATLYVNNRPCPGQFGCDATLPGQLPVGTRLTVYWPNSYQVYEGTAEGIEP